MNIDQIRDEVKFSAVRSRGPGGQNVNKVSSAAVLYWDYSQTRYLNSEQVGLISVKLQNHINKDELIFIRSDEFRDLERNKSRCLEKLMELLLFAFHKPKFRKATKPTRSSKLKKIKSKTHRSDIKKLRQKI